jgi:methionine synthase I (cobalamin-dependent)
MHTTIATLLAHAPILSDGAWGTELQKLGLAIGDCPDALTVTHPAWVAQVARSYVEAGSRVILTNSFGANRIALERYGLAERAAEINRTAVGISKDAAQGKAQVFASMGPSGRLLMMGDVGVEELEAAFAEQAAAMAGAGADAIVLETMTDLDEALIALRAAKRTGLPVLASMVYDSGEAGTHTMMGVHAAEAARILAEAGADVIGANCGAGIESFETVTRILRAATSLPLWIKPNAGLPQLIDGKAVYAMSPDEFASYVPALLAAGAAFIGGCCGTTPEHVGAVRKMLDGGGEMVDV